MDHLMWLLSYLVWCWGRTYEHPSGPLSLISVHGASTQEDVSPHHHGGHVGPVVGQGDGQVGHMVAIGSKTEMVDTGPDPDQPPKVKSKD